MDPEISLFFQSPVPEGIPETQVSVQLSPEYDRQQLPSDNFEIETTWAARREQNPWLFDAPKFRLHSIMLEGTILSFQLGLTCYKDFVGTNLAERAGHLQEQGFKDFGNSQAYLAEPLGVGAMVHTTDDQFVFLRRSLCVGEAPGKIDVPGGHPEPLVRPLQHEDFPRKSVVQELFSSVLREIEDELCGLLSVLSRPLLLGIARNQTSAGRCSAEFYVRCSLTSEQIRIYYVVGGAEAHESTGILFVSRKVRAGNDELWHELSPSAKGAITLYEVVMGEHE
uniref:Nudix hydrolase 22 n=1 Tax=Varanus komodoensis TaxID=61221 RepID=A0A8D2JIB6_VARKO